jgi:hypothetical protein
MDCCVDLFYEMVYGAALKDMYKDMGSEIAIDHR